MRREIMLERPSLCGIYGGVVHVHCWISSCRKGRKNNWGEGSNTYSHGTPQNGHGRTEMVWACLMCQRVGQAGHPSCHHLPRKWVNNCAHSFASEVGSPVRQSPPPNCAYCEKALSLLWNGQAGFLLWTGSCPALEGNDYGECSWETHRTPLDSVTQEIHPFVSCVWKGHFFLADGIHAENLTLFMKEQRFAERRKKWEQWRGESSWLPEKTIPVRSLSLFGLRWHRVWHSVFLPITVQTWQSQRQRRGWNWETTGCEILINNMSSPLCGFCYGHTAAR